MEFNGSIVQSLENKIILVTGATGYLAKLFVEKLLRVQPNVKHLFLLLRAADASSPTQRLNNDVTGKELFRVLREKRGLGFDYFISEKVTPIFGDVSLENLGIEDSDLEKKMHKEIHLVANFAATTNFHERYDVALAVNTMGAKHVLDFAEKCENLEMILHVSTAFVCNAEMPEVILEKPLSQILKESSKFLYVIEEEKKLMQHRLDGLKAEQVSKKQETAAMKELGLERAKFYGWPNTYAFTKALGEMIIGPHLKTNFPVVIVRPTGVTGTYREPFPGWIEGFKALDPMVVGVGRGKLPCFLGDYESLFDIIPGDMVVNAIIVAMVNAKANSHIYSDGDDNLIYHISSSAHREPTRLIKLLEYAYDYFCKNPLMGRDIGEIVKPVFFPTMSSFQEHVHNNYVVTMKF
ncbi:probable fatty acyl-CoA reductase 5 isoform X2 [Papaver somniferum]|uniref:probable fatty acyl-CoA reductase 5 isoform X2 n=1 Tax=Papaver somniferum TaxID=3469 RepID=UPI000E6F8DFA|nr:probable fatty acyl-CoA reductase 5 isoform X2 [Papaver somniferum]